MTKFMKYMPKFMLFMFFWFIFGVINPVKVAYINNILVSGIYVLLNDILNLMLSIMLFIRSIFYA